MNKFTLLPVNCSSDLWHTETGLPVDSGKLRFVLPKDCFHQSTIKVQ